MATYVVDPLSLMRAQLLTVGDRQDKKTDAVFVHGSPAADDEIDRWMLEYAVELSRSGKTGPVVVNSLTGAECWPNGQRLAYPGAETWHKVLADLDYHEAVEINPSKHTAAESDALISLAAGEGWKSVTIMSYPHHILRCMLQMVFCLNRAGSSLKVYTRTLPGINWQRYAEKGVLNSKPFSGTLVDVHVLEEYNRIVKYADREGTGYTPHSTLEELIEYYQKRDAL
jgi:hypothetical protein